MAQENRAPNSEGTMILEFFNKDDGSDQFTMELSVEDFERYSEIAENTGVPIEDFMVQLAEAQIREHNTQWMIPGVDEEGNISLEGAIPVEIPSLDALSTEGRGK